MNIKSDFAGLEMYWNHGLETAEFALNDKRVKELIERKDNPFDCFIMEQFFTESFLMFGHKFKVPTVTLSTLPNSHHMDCFMGLLTPWSNVPHFMLPYDDDMTFTERSHNTILSLYDLFYRLNYYMPRMQEMAEKYFAKHIEGPVPLITDLEKKVSIVLVNSHIATDSPRPTISGLVNIGGAHIQKPKPLPEDIKMFIESAEEGVVYFSLGSFMKSTEMPKEKLDIIIEGLSRLKQKVIWKYEDESIKNLPKNIMIKKWMPQSDILSHKNVRIFITHGGRFGALEGTYWGKTMLCIPLFGDQHTNVKRLMKQGIALSLDFLTFTADELVDKIKTLLSKTYADKAKTISTLFQDNPIHPMDEAMYWIEYTIRHNGATHLKSKAVNINIFEYLLLDVVFIHLAILLLLGLVICLTVSFVVRFAFGKKLSNKRNKKKRT